MKHFVGGLALIALVQCGTNTDRPAFPLFTALTTVVPPAIVSVTPVQVNVSTDPFVPVYKYEYDLQYYITNQEQGFQGYNLFITSTSSSAESGATGQPYMPEGIEPSFPHVSSQANTASSALITQRVTDEIPAPGPRPFQECERYFFRMTALTQNGISSPASVQVGSCATINANTCPVTTPCSP